MSDLVSLWERLDAAFAAAFLAAMGPAGTYVDLALEDVAVNETWNPDAPPFPRLILYSTTSRLAQSEHGGGGVQRLDVAYPYMGVAIAQAGSYAAARAAAQTLFGRMLAVMQTPRPILAAAMAAEPTSTEEARRVLLDRSGASGIEVRGRQGANGGVWRGIAITAWLVETRV